MALDNLDLREIETGFLYLWDNFSTLGLTGYAESLADFYHEDDARPDRNLFIAWGLVCRFYQPGADTTEAWEAAADYLKMSDSLINKGNFRKGSSI